MDHADVLPVDVQVHPDRQLLGLQALPGRAREAVPPDERALRDTCPAGAVFRDALRGGCLMAFLRASAAVRVFFTAVCGV